MNRRAFLAASAAALLWPASRTLAASSLFGSDVMDGAEQFLGVPYVYGGDDPVRGLDCSSYVSLIWHIPRQSTDTIHNYSFEIDRDDLMPGDVMNRPYVGRSSHCRVFAGWATEDRSACWVYECAFRRGVNTRPIAYDDRYLPIRRFGFEPDLPLPEPSLPDEYEVPYGRFFTQTGSKDGLNGFQVVDRDDLPFYSEFRRLGGVPVLGYPLSRRFDTPSGAAQLFARGLLRWHPSIKRAERDSSTVAPADARVLEQTPLMDGPVDWRPTWPPEPAKPR